jgi:hypothetical protein
MCRQRRLYLAFRLDTLSVLASILVCSLGNMSNTTAAQRGVEEVLISDPRALNAAVQEFQRRCHCVVTYEDVKWQQSEVQDISSSIQRAPGAPQIHVPKERSFIARLPTDLASATPERRFRILQDLLEASEAAGNNKQFRVQSRDGVFHVLPKTGALLDTPLTFPAKDSALAEVVSGVVQLVGQSTGRKILVGAAPINLLRSAQLTGFGATNERAGDVLVRAMQTAAPGFKLSWQLLFDYARDTYYLSIQLVD